MILKRQHFSQRETARMLRMNDRKVLHLIRSGVLQTADLSVPGKKPRLQIRRDSLVEFARERNIELSIPGQAPVLVLSLDPLVRRSLEGIDCVHFHDGPLSLAYQVNIAYPSLVVLDLVVFREACIELAMLIRRQKSQRPRLVALVETGDGGVVRELFDRWLERPLSGSGLVDLVEGRK
jgi:hypothetical protein